MYAWIFRRLPGPLWVRIVIAVLLIAAVLVLLAQVVFPWVSGLIQLEENTIGTGQGP